MHRKEFLARRAGVQNKRQKEKAIAQKLLPFFNPGQTIAAYMPIKDEVDVFEEIQSCIQQLPDACLVVPKVLSKTEMIFLPCLDLEPGTWGILEPKAGKEAEKIPDVLVVPMAGFDGLHRMGYGGGYYDRYLAAHPALKIGIAFDEQEGEIETNPWDIDMDIVITPTRMIRQQGSKPGPDMDLSEF